ncbi:MAG TPA: hypothetical protein ENK55_05050 [Actinobacteria bacterium]|nr:hypothetical protein [Actinomycetota bacterium]
MEVRRARPADLPAIDRVAEASCVEALAGVVPPEATVEARRRLCSRAELREGILAGRLLVGELPDGRLVAFALVAEGAEVVELRTAVAPRHPSWDLTATPFVAAVRRRGWCGPITAEALLGDVVQESFLEGAGFVPGEVWDDEIAGHPVVRRRWWLPAAARARSE